MALLNFNSDFLTIDIGFRNIKIVQVRKKKDKINVVNYGIGQTPRGCIKNGAINDKDRVVSEIRKVIGENALTAKSAKIVMSGTNIITRIIMVKKVSDNEMDKTVWDEIHASLPINLDEHKVDYKILDVVKIGNEDKVKVFVTAVSKRIIGSYADILKSLGLEALAVDIPANSIAKLFQKDIIIREDDGSHNSREENVTNSDTIAVLDLGSETTIVNILKNKIPEFNRVILLGGSNIDNAIFKALDLNKQQIDKAEIYKKMYGLVARRDPNNDLEWQTSEATRSVITEVVKHIKMCFEFYVNRCTGDKISRIYMVGGGSQMKGLKDYFEEVFGIPTYQVNLLELRGIEFAQGLNTEKMNFLINAMGIAL